MTDEGTRRSILTRAGLLATGVGVAVLHGSDQARAQPIGETMDITPPAGDAALKLRPSGAVPPSTSSGGALNLDNSASRGAGAVLYSNQGADALGRLLVVNQANPANPQHAVRIQNAGTSHTVSILHDPAGGAGDPSAEALDIVSTNPLDTTLGVEGQEQGRGTVKITHQKPAGSDTNASAISIALLGAGTASQGIFIGNDAGNPTTGKLLNIRNGGPGTDRLVLTADGKLRLPVQGPLGGIAIGGDVSLYRSAAGVLATDGALAVSNGVGVAAAIAASGMLPPLRMFDVSSVVVPSGPTNLRSIEVYKSNPRVEGLPGVWAGVTGSTFSSFQHQLRLRPIANGSASFARVYGFFMPPDVNCVGAGWTVPSYAAVRIEAPGGEGQITQLTGIDIRDFKGRALMNYSLRSFGKAVHMRHSGGVSIGAQATPDTLLHLHSNGSLHGSVTLESEATDAPTPGAGTQARLYIKDSKLVIQWNKGGTVLYTTIPLDSAGPYPVTPAVTTDTAAP